MCPLVRLSESSEVERNEPNSWNCRRSGGRLMRKGKSTKQRKDSGNRSEGLGRLRRRWLKMRRRSGYTSKKSSLHGSDGRARCSRLALRSPRTSKPRALGAKETTHVRHTTHSDGPIRTGLRRRPLIPSTACEEPQSRSHCVQFRLLPRTPPARCHRWKTPQERLDDGLRCSPRLLPSCRC